MAIFTNLALAIALVALAGLGIVLRLLFPVRRQGTADIHRLFELPAFVAAHVALVGPGIDEFALRHHCLRSSGRPTERTES
ncbi:hypothetical protein EMEDMD4_1070034 [Sinorhizobium medicae]|uniref:Uncharacterized protein n=1 Tax=Sinorhizobium medicae TaxID=110321 RepID=A0A508WTQ1_9HYPH|nr:hypothetical protein EMEDMD4_1070034 [Sinorhizobium medicae]